MGGGWGVVGLSLLSCVLFVIVPKLGVFRALGVTTHSVQGGRWLEPRPRSRFLGDASLSFPLGIAGAHGAWGMPPPSVLGVVLPVPRPERHAGSSELPNIGLWRALSSS